MHALIISSIPGDDLSKIEATSQSKQIRTNPVIAADTWIPAPSGSKSVFR
jgi:hypothetical protein